MLAQQVVMTLVIMVVLWRTREDGSGVQTSARIVVEQGLSSSLLGLLTVMFAKGKGKSFDNITIVNKQNVHYGP